MEREQVRVRPEELACPDCLAVSDCGHAPTTLYVHLYNGEIKEVEAATGLRVTSRAILVERQGKPAVRFGRDEVYYACCDKDMQPAQC